MIQSIYLYIHVMPRITAEWAEGKGWDAPAVRPYDKICLDPSAVVFHYASEVIK